MNRKRIGRLMLPVVFVLAILTLQVNAQTVAQGPVAPLAITNTPTGEQPVVTEPPVRRTSRFTPIPYDPRARPGGPGNLISVLISSIVVVGGGILLVTALWSIARMNRRKG